MTRRVLSRLQSFHLMNLVKQFYASEDVSDKKFAEFAEKNLGFLVTESHVYHARSSLEIPAWQPKSSANRTLLARIEQLESTVAGLCKELNFKL